MFDRDKERLDENESKKDNTSPKTNSLFDIIVILEEKRWNYRLHNSDYNHDPTLADAHPAYRKIPRKEDVLDQIANHAKTGVFL